MAQAEDFLQFQWLIRSVVSRYVSESEVRDVTQAVYLRIFEALGTFKEGFALKPWLYRVMQSVIFKHHRYLGAAKRSAITVPFGDFWEESYDSDLWIEEPLAYNPWEAVETNLFLEQVLEDLPDKYANVLKERYLEELSWADLAERYNITYNFVSTKLVRAMKYARRHAEERRFGNENTDSDSSV